MSEEEDKVEPCDRGGSETGREEKISEDTESGRVRHGQGQNGRRVVVCLLPPLYIYKVSRFKVTSVSHLEG